MTRKKVASSLSDKNDASKPREIVTKRVSEQKEVPLVPAQVSTAQEAEIDFPRGGREVLTALERRSIHQQAQQDVLFNQDTVFDEHDDSSHTKKKKRKKTGEPITDTLSKDLSKLRFLSPKKLVPGTLLLGAVREIHKFDVTISLPFNMVGVVSLSDVSDPLLDMIKREVDTQQEDDESENSTGAPPLSKLFHVGQILPFSVLEELHEGRLVTLTANPRIVNSNLSAKSVQSKMVLSAWVSSVEDHGYIMEYGVKGRSGFLLHKNADEFLSTTGRRCLQVGQVVLCTVLPGAQGRAGPVSINPGIVFKSLFSSADSIFQLSSLLPGMLVNAAVKQVFSSRGLLLSFLDGFQASVSWRHLASKEHTVDQYKTGKKLKARVLWVDLASKTVGLTLQEEIISGVGFTFEEHQIGEIFLCARIMIVDQPVAIQLTLTDKLYGYAPLPLVYGNREDRFGKLHSQGSQHSCRIVNFNMLDGVAIVSLQQSVLDKPFMRYSDIPVGETFEGEITKTMDQGLLVSVTESINAFCPAIHVSDTVYRHCRKKFKVGKRVKCRVLRVDVENRGLLVTLKKSLVDSVDPVLVSYTEASPGCIYTGTVVSIQKYGLIVRFYGDVKGLVSKTELSSTQIIMDPSSAFKLGQVVRCKVLSCEPDAMKLSLSLRCNDSATPSKQAAILAPGHVLNDLIVTAVDSSGISLQHPLTHELAFLPVDMLSDYPLFSSVLLNDHSHKLQLAAKTSQPYVLENVLIVNSQSPSEPLLASTKNMLVRATESVSFPSSFAQLKVGMVIPGYIKKHCSYGSFVQFPNGLSGLAPVKYIKDEFISDGSSVFADCQTVLAKVVELDKEKERFLVTLRCSDLRLSLSSSADKVDDELFSQFENFLHERESALKLLGSNDLNFEQIFKPGEVFKAKVKSVKENFARLVLNDGVSAMADITTLAVGSVPVKGEEVECCVLDLASHKGAQLIVSLNPHLIEKSSSESHKTPSKKLKKALLQQLQPGVPLNATVELVTPYYTLCTCSTIMGPQLAYGLMDTGQLGILPQRMGHLKPGHQVRTVVKSAGSLLWGTNGGLPVVVIQTSTTETSRSASSGCVEYNIGDTITATVKDVLQTQVNVQCGLWRGRVHFTMAADSLEEGTMPLQQLFQTGDVIKARVLRTRQSSATAGYASRSVANTLELTTRPSLMSPSVVITEEVADKLLDVTLSPGDEILGVVRQKALDGLIVSLNTQVLAHVPRLLTSKKLKEIHSCRNRFKDGSVVRCTYVKHQDSSKHQMAIASLIGMPCDPVVGEVMLGHVRRVLAHEGLLVTLPGYTGRVDITDISDHYTSNPLSRFRKSQLIRCCVVAIEDGKVDLSLRPSRTGEHKDQSMDDEPVDTEVTSIEDLSIGQVLRGYVKAVTDTGNFIRLGRQVSARVMITNLSDEFVKQYKELYSVGDLVTGKILQIDHVSGKVEMSLRLSHVDPSKAKKMKRKQKQSKGSVEEKGNCDKQEEESDSDDSVAVVYSDEEPMSEEAPEDDDTMDEDEEPVTADCDTKSQLAAQQPLSLSIGGGFNWNFESQQLVGKPMADSEEEEEDETEVVPSKSKRQKRAAKKAQEQHLYQVERSLLDSSRVPESVEDFDRMVVAHPNSSALWVQYMAFFLHTAEVEKARSIAKRALATISFREECEKLNVWVAWLNLENAYGTESGLMTVFQDAVQQNEPLDVYCHLVAVYERSNKLSLAEQLYQTMVKRFSSVMKVWVHYGLFLMKKGKTHQARSLLQRSLKSLPKSEHVNIISRFAQYEFKHGEPGRGRTMFESILSSYPRRVDIWSIYTDMVIKTEDYKQTRDLFERATSLKLSVQKMKFLLKKFLQFEELHGTPSSIAAVKDKAQSFVDSRITT